MKEERYDLREERDKLKELYDENQVLDGMSQEVQLTRRRNQITHLHEQINDEKDQNQLLIAKQKACQEYKEKFEERNYSQLNRDIFIREEIKRIRLEKQLLDQQMNKCLEVKVNEKMYEFDEDY